MNRRELAKELGWDPDVCLGWDQCCKLGRLLGVPYRGSGEGAAEYRELVKEKLDEL